MPDTPLSPMVRRRLTVAGLALVAATALVTGIVVANWGGKAVTTDHEASPQIARDAPRRSAVGPGPAPRRVAAAPPAVPSAADVESCNQYAQSQTDRTAEVLKDALIGGAVGAGVGAASGAIAGGGKAAGKGAGIGGLVGATAGTLYGLNETRRSDSRYVDAYRSCMRSRGYAS